MENRTKKTLSTVLRILLTLCALGAGAYPLWKYEYFSQAAAVDNMVGLLPAAFVVTGALALTALAWIRPVKRRAPLCVALAVIVALSGALFPRALRGDWWLSPQTSIAASDQPDLTLYAPFAPNTLAASLSGGSTLRLESDLPLIDGATALYPLYSAFARAVYDRAAYSDDRVLCTKTNKAYDAIIAGERDIVFVTAPSVGQKAAAEKAGAELVFTPVGREAFVFVVGGKNPVENLTSVQIRNVYTGKTAKWSTLGWRDGGNIIAFQRPDGSGSRTGLQTVMGDMPVQVPQPLPDAGLIGTNSLMKQVAVEWKGVQPALGYSYRYFATEMYANPAAKLLSIDGAYPSSANIASGAYPYVYDFYAVTNGAPAGNSKLLIDWILSPQGRELIEKTGYTPIGEQ